MRPLLSQNMRASLGSDAKAALLRHFQPGADVAKVAGPHGDARGRSSAAGDRPSGSTIDEGGWVVLNVAAANFLKCARGRPQRA